MREHGRDNREASGGDVVVSSVSDDVRSTREGDRRSDLVFDFSAMEKMSVNDLSLLLTARQMAHADNRSVWITGLPIRTWQVLREMGLAELFKLLPGPRSEVA